MFFICLIVVVFVLCVIFVPKLQEQKQEQKREAERLAAEEKARAARAEYWPKKFAESKKAVAEKYKNSAVVKEIVSYLCNELGEKPLRFIVNCDGVQGFSANRSVTYDFLSHGLGKLSSLYNSYVSGEGVPLGLALSEKNKYFLVDLLAESINEHLGNLYQCEIRSANYYEYDIRDEDGYFKERNCITTEVSSVTYSRKATRGL